jgi:hypothetical protein
MNDGYATVESVGRSIETALIIQAGKKIYPVFVTIKLRFCRKNCKKSTKSDTCSENDKYFTN